MPPVKGKRRAAAPNPPAGSGQPGAGVAPAKTERPVVYPTPVVKEYWRAPDGDFSLTVADARDILGWEEEADDVKFGKDCEECLTPLVGRRVRMVHNTRNRPIDVQWLLTLRQEHLNRRWRMNWETIVVSKTRQVNSGQHRLISLILAELERQRDARGDKHWAKNWPGPVTMESLVVFGAEEDDETFRTFNCGRAMTYSDVLFRSSLLARFEPHKRRALARALDFAVRVVWDRTGLKADPYAPKRTHGESDQLLLNHTRLVRAAEHVLEETSDNAVARKNLCVGVGTAAALLYLFAASDSDPRAWREAAVPNEGLLDLRLWDRAEEFFSLLVGNSPDLRAVRSALGLVDDPKHGCGTNRERVAILVRAWNTFRDGANPGPADCRLEYEESEEGKLVLISKGPDVGGIDRGTVSSSDKKEDDDEDSPADEDRPRPAVPSKAQADADAQAKPATLDANARELLTRLKEDHAGKVLLFKARTGEGWKAYEQDAKTLKEVCGLKPVKNGATLVGFHNSRAGDIVDQLHAAGHRVAAVFSDGDDVRVEDYQRPETNGKPPAPKTKAPKPPAKK